MRNVGRSRLGRAAPPITDGLPVTEAVEVPLLRVVSGEMYPDWEAVYRDNVERLYRFMFTKVGNRGDAEDLTAEVFLAALGPLRISASVGEVRSYLLVTARTVLAQYWRRTLGTEITTIDIDLDAADFAPPLAAGDGGSVAATRAHALLAGLPQTYRRILELRFLESCSVKEAAAELGVSVANAKVLQHRALRRAAQSCGEEQR